MRHNGVAGLVVGEDALLLLRHDAPLLQAGDDAFHRRIELGVAQVLKLLAAGEDRGLVADVREVGAGEAGGLLRDHVQVDVRRERLAARVHVEDRFASSEIGRRHEHLTVEAAGTEQRRVEVLEAVRGAHHDDAVACAEPVELDEQLVQRLILLAVEAVARARGADSVELVDEDDRRCVLARLSEELADARRSEAGEHLDERRGARRVEVRARLRGTALAINVLPVPGGP